MPANPFVLFAGFDHLAVPRFPPVFPRMSFETAVRRDVDLAGWAATGTVPDVVITPACAETSVRWCALLPSTTRLVLFGELAAGLPFPDGVAAMLVPPVTSATIMRTIRGVLRD